MIINLLGSKEGEHMLSKAFQVSAAISSPSVCNYGQYTFEAEGGLFYLLAHIYSVKKSSRIRSLLLSVSQNENYHFVHILRVT